jgi:hypothetical protein
MQRLFSVFFTQRASFLEYQQDMERHKGRSNAESLFEMVDIPSDSQIRVIREIKHKNPPFSRSGWEKRAILLDLAPFGPNQ